MSEDENETQLEFSPLSQAVTEDGITVEVAIYRIAGGDVGWALEVMDEQDTSTTWDELFPTEQAAFDEFQRVLRTAGIRSFLTDAPSTLH